MGLTFSSTIRDKVCYRCFSLSYAGLGTGFQQSVVDGEGASALTLLETYGQYFTLTTASGNAPDTWEPWLVSETCLRVAQNALPERVQPIARQADRDMLMCMEAYARNAVNYDSASTTDAFVHNLLTTRYFVLNHCLRRKPRLIPALTSIDSAFDSAFTFVFNKAGWAVRRRPVVLTITRTEFTGGTWSNSAKTVTVGTATFTASTTLGSYVVITDGTGATTGEYPVVQATTTVLTLASSIGADADAQTDIEGFLVTVSFVGMEASESFDSIASTRWFYTDQTGAATALTWATGDQMAEWCAGEATAEGRPAVFRTHQPSGTTTAWRFYPAPDDTYTLRGEIFTLQPADPTSTTDTTGFAKLAAEFMPVIRRLTLARTLANHGVADAALTAEVNDEIESLFPVYQSPGDADARVGVTDVYRDVQALGGGNQIGGAI